MAFGGWTALDGIPLLNSYEVEPMLQKVKKTSPGRDQIPFSIFN